MKTAEQSAQQRNDDTNEFGFAPLHDAPIPYLSRIRRYYQALGYPRPYRWAQFANVPFTPLARPLSACRVTLVTTAAPYQPDKGDQGPGAPYNAAAKFFSVYSVGTDEEVNPRISHVGYDRQHTTAEDPNTWFPLRQMQLAVAAGRIGAVTPRFHGLPTNRSQKTTMEKDCPELLSRVQKDGADAAVLVPNCPVCHQSVSLAARHLEANGIATVVMACAKDIVEFIGVPRLLFSDFPLGNAAGKPNDPASQAETLELALKLLESAPAPRSTCQSPLRWSDNPDWKLDFYNIDNMTEEDISRRRKDFDAQKAIAKSRAKDVKIQ